MVLIISWKQRCNFMLFSSRERRRLSNSKSCSHSCRIRSFLQKKKSTRKLLPSKTLPQLAFNIWSDTLTCRLKLNDFKPVCLWQWDKPTNIKNKDYKVLVPQIYIATPNMRCKQNCWTNLCWILSDSWKFSLCNSSATWTMALIRSS